MLAFAGAAAAQSPAEKCEAGKNDTAGKLAACLAKAEKRFVLKGDAAAYEQAVTKCMTKFNSLWSKLEQKAADKGGACTTTMDGTQLSDFVGACSAAIANALAGNPLVDDPVTCNSDLSSCNSSYSNCSNSLATCNGDLGSCTSDLGSCNAGTAAPGDVLAGKTFSSSAGLGISGTATAGANVSGADGSLSFAIPDGFYIDSKTCTASDGDLTAANVVSGVNVFGVTGSALPAQRLVTGQHSCFDSAGSVIVCSGTGQDGALQMGLAVSYTDNGNGTITDNRTGLVWEKQSRDSSIHHRDTTYTWDNAFKKVQVLNGNATGCIGVGNPDACCTGAGTGSCSAFAGHTDWRLPNVKELESLVKYGVGNPAIDPAFNTGCVASCTVTTCSCTASDYYWSATTYVNFPANAWFVNFSEGSVVADNKTLNRRVRAVRGGSF